MKNTPTMMKISALYEGKPTFQLIPISKDSVYQEASFDPKKKILTIIAPNAFETFSMLPKLNDDGVLQASKTHESKYKHERVRVTKHFDYVIGNRTEIEKFVDLMTGEENDLSEYFKVEETTETNKKLEVITDAK